MFTLLDVEVHAFGLRSPCYKSTLSPKPSTHIR